VKHLTQLTLVYQLSPVVTLLVTKVTKAQMSVNSWMSSDLLDHGFTVTFSIAYIAMKGLYDYVLVCMLLVAVAALTSISDLHCFNNVLIVY